MLDLNKIIDIEFNNIDHSDYPDYCDVYISRAFLGIRELTEQELNYINENKRSFVYEKLMEYLY